MSNIEKLNQEVDTASQKGEVRSWLADLAEQPEPDSDTVLIERQTGELSRILDIRRTTLG